MWNAFPLNFKSVEGATRLVFRFPNLEDEFLLLRKKAAKALYLFGSQVRSCAEESETKRQKALRDAENLLHKEQERQYGSHISHVKLIK